MIRNFLKTHLLRRLDSALDNLRWQDNLNSLKRAATIEPTVTLGRNATIDNNQTSPSAILVGAHSVIHGQLLVFRHGGSIRIGSYVFLGTGSRIWSSVSISIGNHVLISHNVNIHDNNSHPFDMEARREQTEYILTQGKLPPTSYGTVEAAVSIGDNAWIGLNSVILKGVSVGQGAVIAAGSVVTRDVEPFTLVAGNPARAKRTLR